MAENRFIDLDRTLQRLEKEVWWTESEKSAMRQFLYKSKVKDAVPVVRCKGCGFASEDLTECTIKFDQDGEPLTIDPMYYCADGKPRRDGRSADNHSK